MKNFSYFLLGLIAIVSFVQFSLATQTKPALPASVVTKLDESVQATQHIDTIVLGAGCFWGAEKRYQSIPGVVNAVSGYADGRGLSPNYREITKWKNKNNPNNFAEVVEVTFDTSKTTLAKILMNYFEGHDPTQLNRQGNDIGTQYRSTILTNSKEQSFVANKVLATYQELLTKDGYGAITTKVKSLDKFYPAENYHQDYLAKNPNGYCPDHSTGVTFAPVIENKNNRDNTSLTSGKQIVVIESSQYCPYCEKFKENVLNSYKGDIPVSFRLASQLDKLTVKTPTWATPTILFLQDGKEMYGKQGYMTPKEFYAVLGAFKLGQTEAYRVAFDQGTDSRFCKQYDLFKNTPDGQFVDKLSGAPLFDTKNRFDSGTGWLSFTKAIDGSVVEKQDSSFGLNRIEIRSKTSGIHLGHVFPDGPGGKPRFCINATVLEFVPRKKSS